MWAAQEHQQFLIPMGPWKRNSASLHPVSTEEVPDIDFCIFTVSESDKGASELLRQNFVKLCGSWRPGALSAGYPEERVDEWISKAQDEIRTMKVHSAVAVSGFNLMPGTQLMPPANQWQAS